MRDNQSFSWEGLLALVIVAGLGGAFFVTAAPLWLIGAVPVAVTAITLLWHAVALSQHRAPGTVILARSSLVLIGVTALMVGLSALLTIFAHDRSQRLAFILLVVFLGGLLYVASLPTALLFYVADAQGLSRQVLSLRKTLPWDAIDWIYAQENRVSANAQIAVVDIPVFRWTEKTIIVEAGANRRLILLTSAPLVGGDAKPLTAAIRQRATHALIGLEQLPAVNARRSDATASGNRPAYHDLTTAITLARTGALAQGCTLFPARLGPIWLNLVSMVGLGLALIAAGFYAFIADNSLILQVVPRTVVPAGLLAFFPALDLGVFVIVGIVFLAIGVPWLRAVRDPRAYFLLVAPDGFAAVRGNRVKRALFSNTRTIEIANGGLYGQQIKTTLRDGDSFAIEVNIFGRARDLLAYLLSASKGKVTQPAGPLGVPLRTEQDVG